MTWVRHSDDFSSNPKVIGLPDKTYRLHFCALEYCARHLTDGAVSELALPSIGVTAGLARPKSSANALVRAGLWETQDGVSYVIHDYLEYNPSAATVKAERKKAAERMRRVRAERSGEVPPHVRGEVRLPSPDQSFKHLTTNNSSTSPQDPAAVLKQLGWKPWQIEQGLREPLRALAWANASHTARNPGGWAWHGYFAGGSPTPNQQEEKPKMNVVDACQRFIESIAWDETFDEEAMREEFGRIQRKPRTEGTLTQPELAGLLEQWAATRQDRHGIPANLGAA